MKRSSQNLIKKNKTFFFTQTDNKVWKLKPEMRDSGFYYYGTTYFRQKILAIAVSGGPQQGAALEDNWPLMLWPKKENSVEEIMTERAQWWAERKMLWIQRSACRYCQRIQVCTTSSVGLIFCTLILHRSHLQTHFQEWYENYIICI